MNLLLIEDEHNLVNSIVRYVEHEGYHCEYVYTFEDAWEKINLYEYDCILVDLTLPDGNGIDLIRQIKKLNINSGIIVISARNSPDDRVQGLEIGADDYLSKPFDLSELNARIKAVIRRKNFHGRDVIEYGDILISPYERWVRINGSEVNLTRTEFDLMIYFLSNINKVITKESIAEHLWGDHMDNADSFDFIYAHLKNLRRKIVASGGDDYIQTVYGVGYKFAKE